MEKKRYDCQTQNSKGIIDVKEHIWLTNVKYLRLLMLHGISILYMYTCVPFQKTLTQIRKKEYFCQTRKPYVVIDMKEQIWLPSMKCLWITLKLDRYLQKRRARTNITAKQGMDMGSWIERTNMAYICKIFGTVNIYEHYTYAYTVSKVIHMNTGTKYVCPTRNTWVVIDDKE